MKTKITTILVSTMISCKLFGQAPIVYINFVSHNEPSDNLHTNLPYQKMKTKVLQLSSIIDSKGASWNLQTCDGFARGAWNNEVNPILSNVFKTISSGTYADNIEIDPRPKTSDTILYNITDTWHYLDTLGCLPTQTVGGFLYSTQNATIQPIDWWKFQDTITAKSFAWEKWKANLMWGAGSYMPHTNDLNDYGIWKPSATHDPTRRDLIFAQRSFFCFSATTQVAHLVLPDTQANASQNQKSHFFANAQLYSQSKSVRQWQG